MGNGSVKESLSKLDKYLSALLSNRNLQGEIPPIEERELIKRAEISPKTGRKFTKALVEIGYLSITEEPNLKSRVNVIHVKNKEFLYQLWRFASRFRKKKDDVCVHPL